MDNQHLESLLEEALQSVQDNIPSMVQSLQNTQPWTHSLDNSQLPGFRPILNILQDLSYDSITVDRMDDVNGTIDLSNTSTTPLQTTSLVDSISTPFDTTNPTTNTTTATTTTTTTTTPGTTTIPETTPIFPPNMNFEQIQQMSLFHMTSEYLDSMRLFQENMGAIIRHIHIPASTSTTRTIRHPRSGSPTRGFRRDRTSPLIPFLPSTIPQPNRNGQIALEFHTAPFAFMNSEPPPPPVPTLQQFTQATETLIFNSESMSRIPTMTCPITLEDFQHGELLCQIKHCRHIFKEYALRNWFVRNTHCPVCRYDICGYVPPSEQTTTI